MPDLRPTEHYIAAVTRLEGDATRATAQSWESARSELLAALSGLVGSVDERIENLLATAAREAGQAIQATAPALAQAVDTFVALQAPGTLPLLAPLDLRSALRAWQAATYGLMLSELARLRATNADAGQIIARIVTGSDGRQSVYAAATTSLQLTVEQAVWAGANGRAGQRYREVERRDTVRFQRQAIAAIDRRTTPCCLRVHGQIVDLNQPFHLTGTPRFAEYIQAPPFHYRCRTAIALYLGAMEEIGTTTEEMRARARAEFARR